MMAQATIVISAAGCGSRLGMKLPKSLVKVAGRPILEWQLTEMCRPGDTVRIVVGYMGDKVAALATKLFPRIEVLYNHHWATTKTAASLSIGTAGTKGRCLSLDGDLLVRPHDFRQLLSTSQDVVGVTPVNSSQPVFAVVNSAGKCEELSYTRQSPYEWTGLVNFDPREVPPGSQNVFQMIECRLPSDVLCVQCAEVDTVEDLERAEAHWKQYLQQTEVRRAA